MLPKPDAMEIGGLGVGEMPVIKLVFSLVPSPSQRQREIEEMLAELLKAAE